MAVCGLQLCKHVPVARQQILNNATVGLQQCKSCVFYMVRAKRLQARRDSKLSQLSVESQFRTGVCEEGT
jgi:hypothetical protein